MNFKNLHIVNKILLIRKVKNKEIKINNVLLCELMIYRFILYMK